MVVELDPHQLTATKKMHNGSVLTGGVGTGKSRTSLFYYYTRVCGGMPKMADRDYIPMARPRDLYIITTAKKRDKLEWEEEGAAFVLGRSPNQSGVSMHVDSWNNIAQYEDVEGAFFVFDEQRLVGNGAWVKVFLKIAKNNQWILLSATPGDTWLDYIPLFLANGFYKNRTEFYDTHVEWDRFAKYPKVRRFHGEARLEALRAKILVDMPFTRHTRRILNQVLVEYNKGQFESATKQRWNIYEDRPMKDAAELQIVMRKIVNSDPSRTGELMRLMEKHPKLIVFYNFDYELEILRTLAQTLNYPVGEWNGKKHQEIPETDKWLYLVQYTAGAEGWNCIETDAMVFWSLNYSWRMFEQCQGRIDRLNTPFRDLHYYIFKSMSDIDTRIWKAIVTKKMFNEKKYTQQVWDSYVPF